MRAELELCLLRDFYKAWRSYEDAYEQYGSPRDGVTRDKALTAREQYWDSIAALEELHDTESLQHGDAPIVEPEVKTPQEQAVLEAAKQWGDATDQYLLSVAKDDLRAALCAWRQSR